MNTKAFRFEVKSLTDEGTFEGYASTFHNTDTQGDIIEQGAFKRTLDHWTGKGKPIPVLWQHNPSEPIGITTGATEDTKGLAVQGRLLMGITRAREAFEALKHDVLGGLSIGFGIPKDGAAFDKSTNTRRIREVKLYEYSLVTWPANEEALITGVKSAELNGLLSELRELTALLKAQHPTRVVTVDPEDSPSLSITNTKLLAARLRNEVAQLKGTA